MSDIQGNATQSMLRTLSGDVAVETVCQLEADAHTVSVSYSKDTHGWWTVEAFVPKATMQKAFQAARHELGLPTPK